MRRGPKSKPYAIPTLGPGTDNKGDRKVTAR